MEMYMLIIYFIHGKYVDIMLSHQLWNIQCDFTKLIATIFQLQIGVFLLVQLKLNDWLGFI